MDGFEIRDNFTEHSEVVVHGSTGSNFTRVGNVVFDQTDVLEEVEVDLLKAAPFPHFTFVKHVWKRLNGLLNVLFGDTNICFHPDIFEELGAEFSSDVEENASSSFNFRLFEELLHAANNEGNFTVSKGVHQWPSILANTAQQNGHVRIRKTPKWFIG